MTTEPCQPRHTPISIEAVAHLPTVMLPEMYAGSFFQSAIAAKGIPQLATGPQKCYCTREWLFNIRGVLLRACWVSFSWQLYSRCYSDWREKQKVRCGE